MKSLHVLIISLVLFLFFISCQNTTGPDIKEKIVTASVKSGEVLNYRTGLSGDEEGASIVRQPENYELSTIVRDSSTNWEAVYRYKSKEGFRGTDYAELKLGTGFDGTSAYKSVTLIRLNITAQ